MTPAEINKPLHLFIYIGGAVVIDKIFSKLITCRFHSAFLHLTFCFPAAYMQLETPSDVAIAVRMLIAI